MIKNIPTETECTSFVVSCGREEFNLKIKQYIHIFKKNIYNTLVSPMGEIVKIKHFSR